nr:enolase C-terminal domain-like protein [Sinorhizobium mexicanum]
MKIAHLAHAFDVGVQAYVCGSPLCSAVALQFEAAIPNFEIHEHPHLCAQVLQSRPVRGRPPTGQRPVGGAD